MKFEIDNEALIPVIEQTVRLTMREMLDRQAEPLLKPDEMAKHLKIDRATLDRYREYGLPYLKIGKTVRFDRDEVMRWITEQSK